jgi:hypothetical protein
MRTILMPTEDHASMPAAPETTRLIAQRFEAVDLESGNVMKFIPRTKS